MSKDGWISFKVGCFQDGHGGSLTPTPTRMISDGVVGVLRTEEDLHVGEEGDLGQSLQGVARAVDVPGQVHKLWWRRCSGLRGGGDGGREPEMREQSGGNGNAWEGGVHHKCVCVKRKGKRTDLGDDPAEEGQHGDAAVLELGGCCAWVGGCSVSKWGKGVEFSFCVSCVFYVCVHREKEGKGKGNTYRGHT